MSAKKDNINLIPNSVQLPAVSLVREGVSDIYTKSLLKQIQEKKGIIIIKSTKRNVFCTLMDTAEKKSKN